jgi:hypothetical protein
MRGIERETDGPLERMAFFPETMHDCWCGEYKRKLNTDGPNDE